MKKFVVLTSPRTGSTYIRIWLNYHPQIRCHGELFLGHYTSPDGFRYYCKKLFLGRIFHSLYRNRVLTKLRLNYILPFYTSTFMDSLYNNPSHSRPWLSFSEKFQQIHNSQPVAAVGFKLMYSHYNATPLIRKMINREEIYVLHLIRRNLLKQYTSMVRMRQTGRPHSVSGKNKVMPVTIDPVRFMRYISKQERQVDTFRRLISHQPHFEFFYEDFFSDIELYKKYILPFLGLEDHTMAHAKLKPTSTNEITNEIKNYEAIIQVLSGSPYAHFLDDYKLP